MSVTRVYRKCTSAEQCLVVHKLVNVSSYLKYLLHRILELTIELHTNKKKTFWNEFLEDKMFFLVEQLMSKQRFLVSRPITYTINCDWRNNYHDEQLKLDMYESKSNRNQ